jgi:hypothetical protein
MGGIASSGPAGVLTAPSRGVEDEVSLGQREARDRQIEIEVD